MADFPKGPTEIVRVEKTTFRSKTYVDIRTYFLGPDSPTDYKPCKKGVMLTPELAAGVAQEMLKLAAET